MSEYITTSDWDVEEVENEPSILSLSFTCPECGEWQTTTRRIIEWDDPHESGDSIEYDCDCGCELEIELA